MVDGVPAFVILTPSSWGDGYSSDSTLSCSFESKKRRETATTAEMKDFAAGESQTVYSELSNEESETDIQLIMLPTTIRSKESNASLDEAREPLDYCNLHEEKRGGHYENDDFSFSTLSTNFTESSGCCEVLFWSDDSEDEERDDSQHLPEEAPPRFQPSPLGYRGSHDDSYFTEGFVNVGKLPGVY